jgi:hypothetical protein
MSEKDKVIHFEELPDNLKHTIKMVVEWHSILVYEIKKGMYGMMIITTDIYKDKLVESKNSINNFHIPDYVKALIDTQFKGTRCLYCDKGCFAYPPFFELEILTLCPFHWGYGFSIEIHSDDYGFLDGKKAKILPAHVHVLDENGLRIGMIDITGSCPKKVSDVKEFWPPCNKDTIVPMKITPLTKHRKNIVKWANKETSVSNDDLFRNEWEWAQEMWNSEIKHRR